MTAPSETAAASSAPITRAPITRAMVLCAGLGTRMRPLTDTTPKPLLPLADRSLIDTILDRLVEAGITDVVVNAHYLADRLANHLSLWQSPRVEVMHEPELLGTGGGVRRALDRLGPDPFFVINGDAFWLDGPMPTLDRMQAMWDPERMDILLLVKSTARALGYDGLGDYDLDPMGHLTGREEGHSAPFAFASVQIVHPRVFVNLPPDPFSMKLLFDRAEAAGRLFGLNHDGEWFHVGTPAALREAEAFLAGDLLHALYT